MGIDYFTCEECLKAFTEYDLIRCNGCDSCFCQDCALYFCIKYDDIDINKESDNEEDTEYSENEEHTVYSENERTIVTTCKFCDPTTKELPTDYRCKCNNLLFINEKGEIQSRYSKNK